MRTYRWSGVSRDGLEHLDRWLGVMKTRPGLQRGIEVPQKSESLVKNEEKAKDFVKGAQSMLQT